MLISIGIPVYNSEKSIENTIISVLNQTYSNFELVISDNNSTDETFQICLSYAKKDKRIKLVRQTSNIGPERNFEFVLRKAQGDYFTWLGSDDHIEPNYLSEAATILKSNNTYMGVVPQALFDYEVKEAVQPIKFNLDCNEISRLKAFFKKPGRSHGVFYSIFKRSLLDDYAFLAKPFFAWDWCIILYLISHGKFATSNKLSLISGSNGASSSNNIYLTYHLTGLKRVLPYFKFTRYTLMSSNKWSKNAKLFLIFKLLSLNIYFAILEYRILEHFFHKKKIKFNYFIKKLLRVLDLEILNLKKFFSQKGNKG